MKIQILIIFLAGLPGVFAQSFTLTSSPTVGKSPQACVAADVNGDGKVDVICLNGGGNSVTILTNDGSGTFVFASSTGVGKSPSALAAADLNGDGKVDLVTANNHDGTLTTLTNAGAGGFISNATYTVGSSPMSVIAADINGDGRPDLISANPGQNTLSILTNNVSGGFGFYTNLPSSGPQWVVAADVNGDGKLDLISAESGNNRLAIFTNNGVGVFSLASRPTLDLFPYSVTVADVNGDGKVDFISANQGQYHGPNPDGTLTVLLNNGSGIFTSNANYTVGYFSVGVTAADVNGDGSLDLIAVCNRTNGFLPILTNDGTGHFSLALSPAVGNWPVPVAVADVNNDGKIDIICANGGDNNLSILMNTSAFPSPTNTPSLQMKLANKQMRVAWPSVSAGWSLQQNRDMATAGWSPSGYDACAIADDGTNKSLTMPATDSLFFRLIHP